MKTCPTCGSPLADPNLPCPSCGARSVSASHLLAGCLLLLVPFCYGAYLVLRPTAPKPRTPEARSAPAPTPGFKSLFANIWVGTRLYLRADHSYAGEIVDIEPNHTFPDGSSTDAVRVRDNGGEVFWIPRRVAIDLYVTR